MVRNIDDVKTEWRKLTSSKPVHAAAGAGVLASRTLRDLPSRLIQWTKDNPPKSLPGRANGYVQTARTNANEYVLTARTNANEYVQTARTKAVGRYDRLAEHGKKALNGEPDGTQGTSAAQSKGAAQSKSAAEDKGDLNGKPRGKAPSSRSATSN